MIPIGVTANAAGRASSSFFSESTESTETECQMNDVGSRAESGGDIDCGYEPFAFQDLPRRKGPSPATFRGPLHIQCNGHGDRQHLEELTTAVLSWPYVESNLPNGNSSNPIIPLRLETTAAAFNVAAFISPREFARVLIGAPTIYLALPLVCAHWAIVRGWAEPHYLSSHGLMPPGVLVVYTPRDQRELSICYSFFVAAYTTASKWGQLCWGRQLKWTNPFER
jgi:hypothetical protein